MWSYQAFRALDIARERLEEAERYRLAAEASRAQAATRRPHPVRTLGARAAASVSRMAASLARALDERVLDARALDMPRRHDAAS